MCPKARGSAAQFQINATHLFGEPVVLRQAQAPFPGISTEGSLFSVCIGFYSMTCPGPGRFICRFRLADQVSLSAKAWVSPDSMAAR